MFSLHFQEELTPFYELCLGGPWSRASIPPPLSAFTPSVFITRWVQHSLPLQLADYHRTSVILSWSCAFRDGKKKRQKTRQHQKNTSLSKYRESNPRTSVKLGRWSHQSETTTTTTGIAAYIRGANTVVRTITFIISNGSSIVHGFRGPLTVHGVRHSYCRCSAISPPPCLRELPSELFLLALSPPPGCCTAQHPSNHGVPVPARKRKTGDGFKMVGQRPTTFFVYKKQKIFNKKQNPETA